MLITVVLILNNGKNKSFHLFQIQNKNYIIIFKRDVQNIKYVSEKHLKIQNSF